jgi:hypothetical protein
MTSDYQVTMTLPKSVHDEIRRLSLQMSLDLDRRVTQAEVLRMLIDGRKESLQVPVT